MNTAVLRDATVAKPVRDGSLVTMIQRAAEAYRLPDQDAWRPLAELSDRTEFDGIDTHGDATVALLDMFYAPATIYVTLNYGENTADPVSFKETFPARIVFSRSKNAVKIEDIQVDTSSF